MNQVERELSACNSKYRYPQVKIKMGRVLLLAEAFNRRSRRKVLFTYTCCELEEDYNS